MKCRIDHLEKDLDKIHTRIWNSRWAWSCRGQIKELRMATAHLLEAVRLLKDRQAECHSQEE